MFELFSFFLLVCAVLCTQVQCQRSGAQRVLVGEFSCSDFFKNRSCHGSSFHDHGGSCLLHVMVVHVFHVMAVHDLLHVMVVHVFMSWWLVFFHGHGGSCCYMSW